MMTDNGTSQAASVTQLTSLTSENYHRIVDRNVTARQKNALEGSLPRSPRLADSELARLPWAML